MCVIDFFISEGVITLMLLLQSKNDKSDMLGNVTASTITSAGAGRCQRLHSKDVNSANVVKVCTSCRSKSVKVIE